MDQAPTTATPQGEDGPSIGPVHAQPAVAARAAVLLRQLHAAAVVAVAGVAASTLATRTLLRLGDDSRLWPTLMDLASILVAVVCLLNVHAWRQARREWTGRADVNLLPLVGLCRVAAVVAALAAVAGVLGCAEVFRSTAPGEQAHWWALASAVCTVLAAGFGGIHPLDPAGPRGARQLPVVERWHQHGTEESLDEDTLVLQRRRVLAGLAADDEASGAGD